MHYRENSGYRQYMLRVSVDMRTPIFYYEKAYAIIPYPNSGARVILRRKDQEKAMQEPSGLMWGASLRQFAGALLLALLVVGGLTTLPLAAAEAITVLYDGAVGDGTQTPGDQGFTFGTLTPELVSLSAVGGVTTLDTTASALIYAGFVGNSDQMPTLDRTAGYTVSFTARVVQETHGSDDRAGFSIIVLSDDAIGLELAFWEDEIWAQHDVQTGDDYFLHGESVFTDTTQRLTRYDLAVVSDTYTLWMSNTEVLSGSLRDYTGYTGAIDPYETPNFLFLGDDTTSSSAIVELSYVAITAAESDNPNPPDNAPPAFTSTPVLSATVGVPYRYDIAASDPDTSDALTITAPLLPAWLSFTDLEDGTAVLSGTPEAEGVYAVALLVRDSGDLFDTQAFSITVTAADNPNPPDNEPPTFTSTPVLSAAVGMSYTYDITASDPDASDVLTITAPLLPEWLALSEQGARAAQLSGTPEAADEGVHAVELRVRDSGGLSATQAFSITVLSIDNPDPPDPANTLFLPLVQR
jgi:hypothetical protein